MGPKTASQTDYRKTAHTHTLLDKKRTMGQALSLHISSKRTESWKNKDKVACFTKNVLSLAVETKIPEAAVFPPKRVTLSQISKSPVAKESLRESKPCRKHHLNGTHRRQEFRASCDRRTVQFINNQNKRPGDNTLLILAATRGL